MPPNPIPTKSRDVVRARDQRRCVRCGGAGIDYHHRRRRGVVDSHTHEACNGITLCPVCHAWVHANPDVARAFGWIVTAWESNPRVMPVSTFLWGWVELRCDGTLTLLSECEGCEKPALLDGGLCLDCLMVERCCGSPQEAVARSCGCGGAAAVAIRNLKARMDT